MKLDKKYYRDIDIIRIVSCVAVFLYHLNILKGGYLAVCIFFVLSGYLACKSSFNKDKLSIFSYYKSRLKNIYLPLLIVVLLSIAVISLMPQIGWINLKSESTSVILGYNNFWQLNANLDYFARHISSPFMHFWYIAILLQFDLIFPFIFIGLKKLGDKFNKLIPCIIIGILTTLSTVYFFYSSIGNVMVTYYNTFTRVFSILFGVLIGFINHYYGSLIFNKFKNNIANRIIYYSYLAILILMFIFIDSKSAFFALSMFITTIISCRLIDFGTIIETNEEKNYSAIKYIAKISYEIYLFQYPIIFLFEDINLNIYIKVTLIILLTVLLSCILHFILDFKNKKMKILKYVLCGITLCSLLFGSYQYVIAEDHTKEMKELEELLNKNEKMMQQKQGEYEANLEQEKEEWEAMLLDFENGEQKLNDVVKNLSIVGVGDSVMLGAVNELYKQFPNSYFDCKVSRTDYEANGILSNLKKKNKLGDPIIINLGTNGQCGEKCRTSILQTIDDRQLFWITVTNDKSVHVNDDLINFASKHDNVHIIDWNSISKGHSDYFVSDGIHLTSKGKKAYTEALFNELYKYYLDEFNAEKEKLINEHENIIKSKVSFYGNDLLLNAYDNIQENFKDAKFTINEKFDYDSLLKQLKDDIEKDNITYKIAFAFDNKLKLSESQYKQIINLCTDHKIYILSLNNKLNLNYDNVSIIDFKLEQNYLMVDKIHLTEDGNIALSNILNKKINENAD